MRRTPEAFISRVRTYAARHEMLSAKDRVIVGVSGGVDSMVLLDALAHLGWKCSVVHVNYGLRAAASEQDVAFVQRECSAREIACRVVGVNVKARRQSFGESVQMAARELRYAALLQAATNEGIEVVAVGHHADDQAETVLLNLTRGTGPEGLAGMAACRALGEGVRLVRPLLDESRDSILAYARARGLAWREDASNQDQRYARSRIRKQVLPHLNSRAIARSALLMRLWVDEVFNPEAEKAFSLAAGERTLLVPRLEDLQPVLIKRVVLKALRRWFPDVTATERLVDRIIGLMDRQVGRKVEVGGGAVWRDRGALVFESRPKDARCSDSPLSETSTAQVPGGTLRVAISDTRPKSLVEPNGAWIDAERVDWPLRVRLWRAGDRLRPLGMQDTRKVSDVLTDAKVPPMRRSECHVVCSGDTIVWVIGYQLADCARIRSRTKRFARLYVKPST